MRNGRVYRVYLAGALIIVLAAFLFVRGSNVSSPTNASVGTLDQAVSNFASHSTNKSQTISNDPGHPTVIQSSDTTVTWYNQNNEQFTTNISDPNEVTRVFDQYNFRNYSDQPSDSSALLLNLLPNVLFIVMIIFVFWWFARQQQSGNNQAMSFGRSRARMLVGDKPQVTFADVAGIDEAMVELSEIVDFLRYPEKFTAVGARIPKGVLMVGPPGTGKTLLSRAVAGEAGVPFFSISGSEFVEMFVGVGASRVRDLFEQAKKNSPCIVFVDEIDAVGRQRGAGLGGGHDEREQTLNQLLVEMDGFESNTHVIVIAATNRPDVLDPALLRPGRFDRHVTLDRPDIRGRRSILEVHSRNMPLDQGVDLDILARRTPGFSGADLANMINEAAILTARGNRRYITMEDAEEAIARIIAGPERKTRMMSENEKKTVAFHEMGHALVMKSLEHSDPVHKISIISRGMALGWTMSLPIEDRYLASRAELEDQMAGMLGGRCSEELIFGEANITTGASDDIRKATTLARKMVTEWGMSDKLGPLAFGAKEEMVFLGRDFGEQRNYSEDVAAEIDHEVHALVEKALNRAREVLAKREKVLRGLAARLIEIETMEGAEMDRVIAAIESRHDPSEPLPPATPVDTTTGDSPPKKARRSPSAPKTPRRSRQILPEGS